MHEPLRVIELVYILILFTDHSTSLCNSKCILMLNAGLPRSIIDSRLRECRNKYMCCVLHRTSPCVFKMLCKAGLVTLFLKLTFPELWLVISWRVYVNFSRTMTCNIIACVRFMLGLIWQCHLGTSNVM